MQNGEFKPKCDKPNKVLSQIWDKTKHGLRDWIISHLGLGHSRFGKRNKNLGLSSPFLDVPCLCRKKRRRLIQVFEDQGMEISLLMHGKYGNPFLSKLCRKNPIRSVFGLYKMSFIVYFEFWLSWFLVLREISNEKGQIWPFLCSTRHPFA